MRHEAFAQLAYELVSSARPSFYSFREAKSQLVKDLGVEHAAKTMAECLGYSGDWRAVQLPLVSLHDFARQNAISFSYLAPSREIDIPPVFGPTKMELGSEKANTRAFYFCVLRDATVSSKSNFIVVNDVAILDAEREEMRRLPLNLDVDPQILAVSGNDVIAFRPAHSTISLHRALTLVGLHSFAFGHWLVEFLPRLWAFLDIAETTSIPILIDEQMPVQHLESLKRFIPRTQPIIVLKPGESVFVDELYTLSMPCYFPVGPLPGQPHVPKMIVADGDVFARVIDVAIARLESPAAIPASSRIYLRRKDTQHRRLQNREKVEGWFSDNGFDLYDFAEMSFTDQLSLARSAEIIAGPDGSALFTSFFGRRGARLGVLCGSDLSDFEMYATICDSLGHRLRVVRGETQIPHEQYPIFSDYTIDIGILPSLLSCLTN